MSQRTDLAKQPNIPGLVPAATEATELLRSFTVWEEGRDVVASRVPTKSERDQLQARVRELAAALRPISESIADRDGMQKSLAAFFLGYPSLQNADARGMVAAYMGDLRGLPRFAVERALDDIKHGRVFDRDPKTGREFALNPDWPPSSTRVYDVATRVMQERAEEQVKLQKLLRAKPADQNANLTPEQRAEMAGRIRSMSEEARRQIVPDAHAMKADDERQRRNAERDRQARQAWDEGCRAAWKRLCMEPMYAGDRMMSPELAAKLRPELFVGKDV